MQFATHINVILALDHYLMNDAHVPFCKHLFTIRRIYVCVRVYTSKTGSFTDSCTSPRWCQLSAIYLQTFTYIQVYQCINHNYRIFNFRFNPQPAMLKMFHFFTKCVVVIMLGLFPVTSARVADYGKR